MCHIEVYKNEGNGVFPSRSPHRTEMYLFGWRQTDPAHSIRPFVHNSHAFLLPWELEKLPARRLFPTTEDLTCRQFPEIGGSWADRVDRERAEHFWIRICNGWEHMGLLGKTKGPLCKCGTELTTGSQLCLTMMFSQALKHVVGKLSSVEGQNINIGIDGLTVTVTTTELCGCHWAMHRYQVTKLSTFQLYQEAVTCHKVFFFWLVQSL